MMRIGSQQISTLWNHLAQARELSITRADSASVIAQAQEAVSLLKNSHTLPSMVADINSAIAHIEADGPIPFSFPHPRDIVDQSIGRSTLDREDLTHLGMLRLAEVEPITDAASWKTARDHVAHKDHRKFSKEDWLQVANLLRSADAIDGINLPLADRISDLTHADAARASVTHEMRTQAHYSGLGALRLSTVEPITTSDSWLRQLEAVAAKDPAGLSGDDHLQISRLLAADQAIRPEWATAVGQQRADQMFDGALLTAGMHQMSDLETHFLGHARARTAKPIASGQQWQATYEDLMTKPADALNGEDARALHLLVNSDLRYIPEQLRKPVASLHDFLNQSIYLLIGSATPDNGKFALQDAIARLRYTAQPMITETDAFTTLLQKVTAKSIPEFTADDWTDIRRLVNTPTVLLPETIRTQEAFSSPTVEYGFQLMAKGSEPRDDVVTALDELQSIAQSLEQQPLPQKSLNAEPITEIIARSGDDIAQEDLTAVQAYGQVNPLYGDLLDATGVSRQIAFKLDRKHEIPKPHLETLASMQDFIAQHSMTMDNIDQVAQLLAANPRPNRSTLPGLANLLEQMHTTIKTYQPMDEAAQTIHADLLSSITDMQKSIDGLVANQGYENFPDFAELGMIAGDLQMLKIVEGL